ncbi:MAG: NAD(P)/FAD-dependent oxidoreductase [Pseudomonadota bacterium]|nr:NAD(P)/FAD-dependent oxidoreductase [Pseudomonadota bacterium]
MKHHNNKPEVVVIGAGAAGLMCAIEAGKRGRSVLVLDQGNKAGRKILMSGGGRCNFTNYEVTPQNFICHNPHFCKSALSRFSQWDFLALVNQYQIPFHERDHGQLFCDNSAKDILNMLLAEAEKAGVQIQLKTEIERIHKLDDGAFSLKTSQGDLLCQSLVIASGGLSIPTMGASPFGYQIAEQFGIKVWPTQAGLVPFTLQPIDKDKYSILTGIAIDSNVTNQRVSFRENILFTHRGLSGPAILQISSYWQPGETININLLPDYDLVSELKQAQQQSPQQQVKTIISRYLPKRVVSVFVMEGLLESTLANASHKEFETIAQALQEWQIKPAGTEGYRTAEVTTGGVDCDAISSKTLAANDVPGLYFIGEVLDVTGWLGGYNFQWAWASGWCAGQYV